MESVWHEGVAMPRFAPLRGELKTDVLIIGGGMAGVLCARLLKDAGVDYALVEANRIGQGITKNTTAKITAQHGLIYQKLVRRFGLELAGLYLEANEGAVRKYRSLCQGIDCDFTTQDNYIYALDDPRALEREMDALRALHFPAELTQKLPLPLAAVGAVKFPDQAQFHPLKFLAGLCQGLNAYENTIVRELKGLTAVTGQGTITARKIIVATHFPFLNKHGSYFLKLYQQRSYVISLENAPAMDGMYLDAAENGLSFRSHNGALLLGGGGHRTGKQGGGWRELERYARVFYPGAAITHRWATQDCITLDGIPYIGRYSRRTPALYVATGFNKWGMTSAMVSAQLLTRLVQEKESPYEALFSPSRTMLRPQLGVNAMESTLNLLTPTAPRCPHLGCALKWNSQERSWDCPCHGSRFEADGTLIDNPATGDLKKP